MRERETVIVSAVRTPISDFDGTLKDVSCLELGRIVIEEAIRRAGIKKEDVEYVIMGNVLPAGLGQNPARQAMIRAGLPLSVGALTVNKVCGSGLMAVMVADYFIKGGECDIIVAGGMENMYQAPYYLPRGGFRLWDATLIDGMVRDGLWDLTYNAHMGYLTENVAERFGISRREQDEYALLSYTRAKSAIFEGRFKEEIIPVPVPQKKGPPIMFEVDETALRETSLEALSKLPPVFKENGTITAGNASKLSAAASALVVMSRKKAEELGIKPLARIVAHCAAGYDLDMPTAAPIVGIPKVLKKAGMTKEDIDLFEINEAFAASTLAILKTLELDVNKVNVNGGAIALGHPIGCSGARVLTTLIYALKQRGLKRGLASVCLGGAECVNMIIELEE